MEIDELTFVVKNEPEVTETLVEDWFLRGPTGLTPVRDDVPLKAFELVLLLLLQERDAWRWQMGDWAVELANGHGRLAYEKLAAQYLSDGSFRTVEDWAYVCRGVCRCVRRADLKIGHHRQVVPLKDGELQTRWLAKAAAENWSVRRLGEEIARSKKASPPPRREDRLFEMEQQNAALHRQVDNLTHERDSAWSRSERSETILKMIRVVLAKLVEGGPEGVARDPEGAFKTLKGLIEQISNR